MAGCTIFFESRDTVRKYNVLFIAIDNMNDWIGPLSNHLPRAKAPNLNRLAKKALTPGRPSGDGQLFGAKPLKVPEEKTSDYKVVEWAISKLNQNHKEPFFLACGIFRPHIPWKVPQKYFDMYPLDKIQLNLFRNSSFGFPAKGRWLALFFQIHSRSTQNAVLSTNKLGSFFVFHQTA